MSDKRPELTVTDARELAREMALANLPQGIELDGGDVLMDRCLTGEHCWFFFRNPAISIPETMPITKAYSAYVVSPRGNVLNIFDHSREPSKLEDHLALMSAYFAYKELGGPKPDQHLVNSVYGAHDGLNRVTGKSADNEIAATSYDTAGRSTSR
jgi:hypothetical protein